MTVWFNRTSKNSLLREQASQASRVTSMAMAFFVCFVLLLLIKLSCSLAGAVGNVKLFHPVETGCVRVRNSSLTITSLFDSYDAGIRQGLGCICLVNFDSPNGHAFPGT